MKIVHRETGKEHIAFLYYQPIKKIIPLASGRARARAFGLIKTRGTAARPKGHLLSSHCSIPPPNSALTGKFISRVQFIHSTPKVAP